MKNLMTASTGLFILVCCVFYTMDYEQTNISKLNDQTQIKQTESTNIPQVGVLADDEIPLDLQLLPLGDSRGIVVPGFIKTPQVTYSTLSPDLQGKISTEFEPQPRFRKGGYNYQKIDPEEQAKALSNKPEQFGVNKSLVSSISAGGQVTNSVNNGGFIFIPADPHGAAGPNQVVNVFNTTIEFYDTDGSNGSSQSLESFFAPLSPVNFTFDPKVLYDQYEQRFVVVTLERQDTSAGDPINSSRLLIAVSATTDPNGLWYMHSINSNVFTTYNGVGANRWFDYPGLAVDEEVIYLNGNMFGYGAGGYGGVRLWMIEKTGFYTGVAASVIGPLDPYAGGGNATTSQPAHTYGVVPAGMGTYLMSYSRLASGSTEFWQSVRIDDPTGLPNFVQQYINVGDIEPNGSALPSAPQSGTGLTLETNDPRALDAVWRDGQIFSAATLESQSQLGETSASWWVFDGNGGGVSLADNGIVDGEDISAGTFTFFPSIAVNDDGGIALGYSASSATIFPGSYFSMRSPGDAAGTMRQSEVIRAGTDFYHRTFGGTNRWGDYSAVAVDPNDECFWVYNKHSVGRSSGAASENGLYETAFGEFCNQTPNAGNNTITVNENATTTIVNNGDSTVLNNDSDSDAGDTLSTFIVTGPSDASSFTFNLDGTFSYAHNGDENSQDSFIYEACDDGSPIKCNQATVTVNINPVNDNPVANDDSFQAGEDDGSSTIGFVLNNDSDADQSDTLAAIAFAGVAGSNGGFGNLDSFGEFEFDPNGDFEYLAVGDAIDTDFTYEATDNNGGINSATITVTINGVNDDPNVNDIFTITQEDMMLSVDVSSSATDVDGDILSLSSCDNANNGSVSINGNNCEFTPAQDFNGDGTFDYLIIDGNGGTASASVTVIVTPVNDDPVAVNDSATTDEDVMVSIAVLTGDSDPDTGDSLSVTSCTNASNGVVLRVGNNCQFTPAQDFNGQGSFDYAISDGNAGTASASVTVTVTPVNDDPVAVDDMVTTDEDTAIEVEVLAGDSDVDPDILQPTSCSNAINGNVVLDGIYCDFTPALNFNGQATFDYTIIDNEGGSDSATVTVTVNPIDDAPTAVNDAYTINEDSGLSLFFVTANDTDVDGDAVNISGVGAASNGSAVQNGNNIEYVPDSDFCGSDSFIYDVNGGSQATVDVTIDCVNDEPAMVVNAAVFIGTNEVNNPPVRSMACQFDFGPDNEDVSQAVNDMLVNIQSDPNGILTSIDIDNTGQISYVFTGNSGVAEVTVAMQDDGGVDNSGDDTSQDYSFTVNVQDYVFKSGFDADVCQ